MRLPLFLRSAPGDRTTYGSPTTRFVVEPRALRPIEHSFRPGVFTLDPQLHFGPERRVFQARVDASFRLSKPNHKGARQGLLKRLSTRGWYAQ